MPIQVEMLSQIVDRNVDSHSRWTLGAWGLKADLLEVQDLVKRDCWGYILWHMLVLPFWLWFNLSHPWFGLGWLGMVGYFSFMPAMVKAELWSKLYHQSHWNTDRPSLRRHTVGQHLAHTWQWKLCPEPSPSISVASKPAGMLCGPLAVTQLWFPSTDLA